MLAVSCAAQVHAMVQTKGPTIVDLNVEPTYLYSDTTAYQSTLKESKKARRSVARVDVPAIEASFPADFVEIRSQLIGGAVATNKAQSEGVKTPAELDALIQKYSNPEEFRKLGPQAKLVALQLRALKTYKSFIFRARNYIGKNSITRTMVVTMLRAQLVGVQTFFPLTGTADVNQWEVVFKYITEPQPGMGEPISTDRDLYAFLTHATNDAQSIMNDYSALIKQKQDIWWDNKLFFSFANFASEKDRYVKLGDAELESIYSTMALNLSGLYATTAYSLDGLQDFIRSSGQLFGVDGLDGISRAIVSTNGIDGMTSKSRFQILNAHPNLFKLMPQGKTRMNYAYGYLREAVRSAKTSYNYSLNRGDAGDYLFDGRVANAMFRVTNTSIEQLDQLFEKDEVGSTVVNGERIKVNLSQFYNNPPTHLNSLYPKAWDEGPREITVKAWGKNDKLRNYKYGMAKEWDIAAYKVLFPEIQAVANKPGRTSEVGKYSRIISQTWGTAAFAIPLSMVVF